MINYRYIICLCLGLIIGFYLRGDHRDLNTNRSDSRSTQVSTTSVLKATSVPLESPDLVVSQEYVAMINGEKVSVPIAKKTVLDSNSKPNSTGGVPVVKAQGQLTQTVDLTPLLSSLRPSWELGIGYNYIDNKHYGCVSLQRNYKPNKALELTCQIRDDKRVKGVMVQHKWLIH